LFTEFSVSGQVLKDGEEIYNRKKAVLKKGSNNFQLVVICTDLKNSSKIRYRYRIEEIDKNWIETGKNNRRISYSGLNPGYYTLKVQSTNINGVWENDNTLKIIIPPYFYQTNLFLILIYLLISVIIIFVVAMIIRKIKLKEKMETEKLKTHFSDLKRRNELLRLESLQGQMNPHFLFNSLNSINYFIAISDKISANQYISGFARLIRAILNNSKNQYIPFKQEFEALDDYLRLEHLRFGDKFNYQINCEETMLTDGIELSPSMVQPFVENAIWHGLRLLEDRIGYLTVNFKVKNENCIECIIEDNGVGRVLAEERKSSEMKARKSRGIEIIIEKLKIFNSLNQSNYSVVIEDLFPEKKETGTKVTIEIPARFIYN
jgi:LytS/YehU family sensor histidine kinase